MGKGRTTTGMILACLIKYILFGDPEKIYLSHTSYLTNSSSLSYFSNLSYFFKMGKGRTTSGMILPLSHQRHFVSLSYLTTSSYSSYSSYLPYLSYFFWWV